MAVDSGIPTIIAADALGALRSNNVMGNLVRRDFDNEVAMFGQTVTAQVRTTPSVVTVSHSTTSDITMTALNDTTVSVTMNQHKAVPLPIQDYDRALNRPEILMGYATDGAIALSDTIEAFLITTIAEGAGTAVTGQSDVTIANILAADKALSVAKAPMRDRFAVWHPRAKYQLLQKGVFVGSEATQNLALSLPDDVVRGGVVDAALGRKFGFDHFMGQQVPLYNSSANSQANILFQREACVLATRMLPGPAPGAGAVSRTMDEGGFALRATIGYNVRRLQHETVIDALYGAALFRSGFAYAHVGNLAS